MENFLLEYKNTLTFSLELLAAMTGLVFYKKYKLTAVKFFIYFLITLTICDTLGNYTKYIANDGIFSFLEGTIFDKSYCYWWYTLFWKIGAPLFFSFYYSRILKTKRFKITTKISGYLFLVFSVFYISTRWNDFFLMFFPIISILGAIIVFLSSVFYFVEVLQSDKILTFYRFINFYISFAIFIWWLIVTPLVFYDLYHTSGDWNFIFLRWQIYLFANIFMYLTFTFALIYCKPELKNN